MGLVRAGYVVSMFRAMGGRSIMFGCVSNPYPTRAMNVATQMFLDSDADEMLVIDTDIKFDRDAVDAILSHDLPLVFGLYPKRQLPLEPCVYPLSDENPFGGESQLVEVRRAGRGFMRANRSVFERMKSLIKSYKFQGKIENEFWSEGVNESGEWVSEDWNFCDNWRKLGEKILVDQTICLQHIGDFCYGSDIPSNT